MKAKYEVKRARKVLYFCVTTTRNCEDMINILRGRYDSYGFAYRIFRDGALVFDNLIPYSQRRRKTKKIIEKKPWAYKIKDTSTGKIYSSREKCAKDTGIYSNKIGRQIDRGIGRFQYVKTA